MTGLISARLRAMRENLRGLPIDSRYRPTALVESSSIQYCMKSLPDTSTRLPADPKVETPRLRRAADASTAIPSAPDWANRPRCPCGGSVGASEALSRTAGSLLISPKELGPTTRMPALRARRSSSACRRAPSRPSSAKPEDTTSRALTPASAHSSTTSSTAWAGTAMMARSTFPGTAATDG